MMSRQMEKLVMSRQHEAASIVKKLGWMGKGAEGENKGVKRKRDGVVVTTTKNAKKGQSKVAGLEKWCNKTVIYLYSACHHVNVVS
jgi:hypothetical protein